VNVELIVAVFLILVTSADKLWIEMEYGYFQVMLEILDLIVRYYLELKPSVIKQVIVKESLNIMVSIS